jgi:hypothetical protein
MPRRPLLPTGVIRGATDREETSRSEELAQRGLHYGFKRWQCFLALSIVVNGLG